MRIAVIGGGPGGLYFSYLWKKRHPDARIDLFEQNPAGATWGFGVVFSEQALEFLRADDPDTVDAIAPRMESWQNITLNLRGESVEIDGVGFSSIGRLDLLGILQARAAAVGVALHFETQAIARPIERLRPDRRRRRPQLHGAPDLRGRLRHLVVLFRQQVRLVWHHQAFRDAVADLCRRPTSAASMPIIIAIASGMSTFLVECDLPTWQAYGFADKTVEQSKAICEQVFAKTLDGHGLISNKSVWRNFPWVWNERWFFKNMVLIGDALHSAHFSIGSGTRLAIEDTIALTKALESERNLGDALARYQSERQPIVKKLVTAARTSADWYATFPEHMKLDLLDFAYSYITRSGRIDDARLRAMAPSFMARYEASRSRSAGGGRS